MNILLTTHQFFPEFTAGTETLTYSVASELIRRGHSVLVFAAHPDRKNLEDDDRFEYYQFNGINVCRFRHSYVPMGGQSSLAEIEYNNRLVAAFFRKILKSFQPDIIHFFHLNRLGIGLIEQAVEARVPRFMTVTDFWLACPMIQLMLPNGRLCSGPENLGGNCVKHLAQNVHRGAIKKIIGWTPVSIFNFLIYLTRKNILPNYSQKADVIALSRRMSASIASLNHMNRLIVPTDYMREFFIKAGVLSELVVKVEYGTDVKFKAAQSYRKTVSDPLTLGFIGTLSYHKGCHILLHAMNELRNKNIVLKIYGSTDEDVSYFNSLRSISSGNPSIEFCGTFPNSKIHDVISDVDVLIVPSIWYENSPLVLHSAQRCGCPVICSDLPGLSSIIGHNDNGLLFKPGDSGDLARQILRFVEDDSLISQLGANARPQKTIQVYVDELVSMWNHKD